VAVVVVEEDDLAVAAAKMPFLVALQDVQEAVVVVEAAWLQDQILLKQRALEAQEALVREWIAKMESVVIRSLKKVGVMVL
jgi:hypothetical protein